MVILPNSQNFKSVLKWRRDLFSKEAQFFCRYSPLCVSEWMNVEFGNYFNLKIFIKNILYVEFEFLPLFTPNFK